MDQVHLHLKDSVEISARKGAIITEPVTRKSTLNELLDDDEPLDVADWGAAKGKEVW